MISKKRAQVKLTEVFFLFTCGVAIGVTLNFATKWNENERSTHHDAFAPVHINHKTATDDFIRLFNCSLEQREILSSKEIFAKVKVLCIVLTTEPYHQVRAIHVKNTWARRCNKLIFASNVTDAELGSVALQENDDYGHVWGKTKHAMIYAYENFRNDYDWLFKADDNTYALLDNMRYMLAAYSPDDPVYFGKKFKYNKELGHFSGGAGYVMSKKALKKFVTEALPDPLKCRPTDEGAEDWELGICMHNVGVYPGDARDRFKHETFFPFQPGAHLFPLDIDWYWKRQYYPDDEGLDCCSNLTISFHYVPPDEMYLMDYLAYNLQAYGVRHRYEPMPEKTNFTAVVKALLAEISDSNILN